MIPGRLGKNESWGGVLQIRLESVIVCGKVLSLAFLFVYFGSCYAGTWISSADKWTMYACFLTVSLGLNMSLLLRRTKEGLADRFRVYTEKKLCECAALKTRGEFTEKSMTFIAQCAKILSQRFKNVTLFPGKILSVLGFIFSGLIAVVYLIGIPKVFEQWLVALSLPGVVYYGFIGLVYVDIVVQLNGVCLDVRSLTKGDSDTADIIPEVKRIMQGVSL